MTGTGPDFARSLLFQTGKVAAQKGGLGVHVVVEVVPGDIGRDGVVNSRDETAFLDERDEIAQMGADCCRSLGKFAFVNAAPRSCTPCMRRIAQVRSWFPFSSLAGRD